MPDPILPLINFTSPATFTHDGYLGKVYPQFMEAGSKFHHSKYFYVEFPANETGSFYQVDASRLVSIIGDGGVKRHFSAMEVSAIISGLYSYLNLPNLLKSISL